jgi:single-strand DNA-binding protein
MTHFSLAVSERWKSAQGENKESTEWVNVEAWGRLGEICQQFLHKGRLIYLEGRLKTDKYEDKSGETKYYTKVVATSMQMLDRKPEEEPVAAVEEARADYEA